MLVLLSIVLFLGLCYIAIRSIRRSCLVERATFSNSTVQVNLTRMVRRHLLSTSTLSIIDVVPKDLLDCDDEPRLTVVFKKCGGSYPMTFDENKLIDVVRDI
jgi:hypothetical protein